VLHERLIEPPQDLQGLGWLGFHGLSYTPR
jgi:hypothetical protein